MSLSNQSTNVNPVKHYLRVKSGSVNYYDKEEQKNIDVPTPLEFVVLDQLATVKGWSDADQSGYWSNEVRSAGQDVLTVRTKNGIKAEGVWKDIKGNSMVAGAKFNTSVYIATKGRDGLEIQNIAFSGAALNAWIEFVNANKGVTSGKGKVVITGFDDAKKGAVKYQVPHFEVADITDTELAEATELDKELQDYLEGYFANRRNDEVLETAASVSGEDEAVDLSEIPF
tara:strand:+ start:1608 stop:2291 length:684 start_codon:yes stop_codon:yes gene_type:complete